MSKYRLNQLQIENDNAGAVMKTEAGRFAALASRHKDGTAPRAVSSFNLFQTPPDIAEQLARLVAPALRQGGRFLEPSAGLGRLYKAVRHVSGAEPHGTLVEVAPQCAGELYAMTEDDSRTILKQDDFLTLTCGDLGGKFDAVIMNPPFKQGLDIKHILRAAEMLKPGGILAALCYNGVRQNRKLKPLCDSWEVLPDNSFGTEGTRAGVIILTIKNNQGSSNETH